MLEPKPLDGTPFILSKFSALTGREILLQYPSSALPKVGDYSTNEAMMLKILSHVGITLDGRDEPLMLTSRQLVDNHVTSAEQLIKLEWAMMNYNFAFFGNGSLSGILDLVATRAVGLIQQTLTDLSPVLQAKQAAAAQP